MLAESVLRAAGITKHHMTQLAQEIVFKRSQAHDLNKILSKINSMHETVSVVAGAWRVLGPDSVLCRSLESTSAFTNARS